mgnify:CR=1 FL=1
MAIKKIIFAVLAFSMFFGVGITAPRVLALTTPTGGTVNFATLQKTILSVIDASVARLNNAESKISSNTQISPETKEETLAALNSVEAALLSYRSKVSAATTTEELQAINQQIIQYLKDNKDVIRANVSAAILDISAQAAAKAIQFLEDAEQLLNALKITCPSQKATIDTLQKQIEQLSADIEQLNNYIQAKNVTGAKQEMKAIAALIPSMVNGIKQIQASCLQ